MRSFLVFLLFIFDLADAQSMQTDAPRTPTNFSNHIPLSDDSEISDVLRGQSGVNLQDYGGEGKARLLSIRGSRPADIGVSLEGIRLNAPAQGEFDFGKISAYGLEEMSLVRGAYAPYSTNPSGQILLSLPRNKKTASSFSYGSYDSFFAGLRLPYATFSFDQSESEYPYEYLGAKLRRENNFHQRLNLRSWKRFNSGQVWGQILYTDENLPGPTYYLSPHASLQTFAPTLAYQARWKNYDWSFWGNFQAQEYKDPDISFNSENLFFNSGFKESARYTIDQKIHLEGIFDWTQDKLFSNQTTAGRLSKIRTPLRHTVGIAANAYIDITDKWLFNPRLRLEFTSDLPEERLSVHRTLASRYRMNSNLSILANFHHLSRAPNFNEMYFEDGIYTLANRNLKRQRSVQSDLGYEFQNRFLNSVDVSLQQAVFVDRTEQLLVDDPDNIIYQIQNLGRGLTYGVETNLSFSPTRSFKTKIDYTLMHSEVANSKRAYQPTHKLFFEPSYTPDERFAFALPFYTRSKVKAPISAGLSAQYDLGFKASLIVKNLSASFQLFNLLAKDREEVFGYPLSNETHMKLSLSFNGL